MFGAWFCAGGSIIQLNYCQEANLHIPSCTFIVLVIGCCQFRLWRILLKNRGDVGDRWTPMTLFGHLMLAILDASLIFILIIWLDFSTTAFVSHQRIRNRRSRSRCQLALAFVHYLIFNSNLLVKIIHYLSSSWNWTFMLFLNLDFYPLFVLLFPWHHNSIGILLLQSWFLICHFLCFGIFQPQTSAESFSK